MSYIDGFVIAVPTANKAKFITLANKVDSAFIDHGATRLVECWGADVPKGTTTDFQGAVAAQDDETVAFSWIEWPDKASRDSVMNRMDELSKTDERFDPAKNPMPFDGKRMIYGGFEPIVEQGESGHRQLRPRLRHPGTGEPARGLPPDGRRGVGDVQGLPARCASSKLGATKCPMARSPTFAAP